MHKPESKSGVISEKVLLSHFETVHVANKKITHKNILIHIVYCLKDPALYTIERFVSLESSLGKVIQIFDLYLWAGGL